MKRKLFIPLLLSLILLSFTACDEAPDINRLVGAVVPIESSFTEAPGDPAAVPDSMAGQVEAVAETENNTELAVAHVAPPVEQSKATEAKAPAAPPAEQSKATEAVAPAAPPVEQSKATEAKAPAAPPVEQSKATEPAAPVVLPAVESRAPETTAPATSTAPKTEAPASSAISESDAKAIALTHAGVSHDSVTRYKIERDRERGTVIYELEFRVGRDEYEYDIDSETGKIIGAEKNDIDILTPKADPAPLKTEAEAYNIALTHAGVKAENVRRHKIELDRDKGVTCYEIEFKSGGYEYEYKINAANGEIVKSEKEFDD